MHDQKPNPPQLALLKAESLPEELLSLLLRESPAALRGRCPPCYVKLNLCATNIVFNKNLTSIYNKPWVIRLLSEVTKQIIRKNGHFYKICLLL